MFLIDIYNKIKYGRSDALHAGIVSKVDGNKVLIHEAIEKQGSDFKAYEYDISWLENRMKEGKVIIRRPNVKLSNVEKICKSYEDTYYDWLSIILFPFKLSVNSTKALFCSEAVGRILYDASNKKLNIASEFGLDYEKISPQDLFNSLQLTTQ